MQKKEELGFTTGTQSGDLNAKFGPNRFTEQAFVTAAATWMGIAFFVPMILAIFVLIPLMGAAIYFFDWPYVSELIAFVAERLVRKS